MSKQDYLNDSLIQAVKSGDAATVQQLIDAGANVHAMDDWSLRCAPMFGHTDIVRLLLDRGADVHAMNDDALREAVHWERWNCCVLLLSRMMLNAVRKIPDEVLERTVEGPIP